MTFYNSDTDSDEGLYESNFCDDSLDFRRNFSPQAIDYQTWKKDVGGLIQSETHVLLDDDEKLRMAITQAMFLETASENLLMKRKQQIELLDDLREKEGGAAAKLFEDVKPLLKNDLGLRYDSIEQNLTSAIAKSKQPLNTVPDVTQPPPSIIQLPPMNLPPPSTPNASFKTQQSLPELISHHLVPPPMNSKTEWSDKEEKEHEESTFVEQKHRNDDSPRGPSRFPIGDQSTSWRTPYHPTPLPPPEPSPFLSSQFTTPFNRLSIRNPINGGPIGPIAAMAGPTLRRRSFERAPPFYHPNSPPGLVGVNVRGIFVGRRRLGKPSSESFRRHSFGNNFNR